MVRHPAADYDAEYLEFQREQDVPVHEGLFVPDVREVETESWALTGGEGAFLNLKGMEKICDIHVHDIPAGDRLNPLRHLFDCIVYVVEGTGITQLGTDETAFEWERGAMFYLPKNTEYVHANVGEEPARLLSVTSLPLLYTVHKNHEVIWENDSYSEWDDTDGTMYGSSIQEVQMGEGRGKDKRAFWEADFVADVSGFDKLEAWPERGGGGSSVNFPFRRSSMYAHISEFDPGRYKKAHRHHPGANVLILSGEGYSLMWREKHEERTRIDWTPYTLLTPPTLWFHQHFNTSTDPARYLAIHAPQLGMRGTEDSVLDSLDPVNQIEYPEEDPAIRDEFEAELDAAGLESEMTDDLYRA